MDIYNLGREEKQAIFLKDLMRVTFYDNDDLLSKLCKTDLTDIQNICREVDRQIEEELQKR